MFYFDKQDDRVLFQDIRDVETTLCDGRQFEVKPDVKADFTSMPYSDESFSMVVFDPPHLKYTVSKKEKSGSDKSNRCLCFVRRVAYGRIYSQAGRSGSQTNLPYPREPYEHSYG